MNKNILELCLSPDLGGLELYMVRASHYLNDTLKVISIINQNGKLEQYYKDTNFKYLKIKRNSKLLSFFTAKELAKLIDEHEIDVIHLHWTNDIPVAVLAKIFSKSKPKLVQTRNMTMTRFKDDFYHKFLYKNMDMMLPVTYQVKDQIEKFIPQDIRPKVEALYMGASSPILITKDEKSDLRHSYNLGESFTVGIVGRIEEGKGQYLVIDAIEKMTKENIDAKALIVGHSMEESYLDLLKDNISTKGIEDKIIFTGFTTKVQQLMQICDVIVLATNKETFGLVLIEAMKCSITIVGSDSGGPLEIIDDNKSGLLFNTMDSNDLYEKLKYLYDNPSINNKFAKAGYDKAHEMFDDTKQFEKLKNILEDL